MNTRKDNNGVAIKKWLATPPGHIAKPMRRIIDSDCSRGEKGQIILGVKATIALRAAKRGDGLTLQQMARAL